MTRGRTVRERVVTRLLEEEMQESFLDYSMSVIVQRALPDARDGLKPVHRRILYAMYDLGLLPERAYKKSAAVVGEVLGKYHPHGDAAVYDALVRMAQTFSLRMPLIDGQGNFGSIDGDPAAAYRYTEARLGAMAVELLDDLGKDTVDHQPNFDGRIEEPTVLPGRFPNLLVNGSAGIAVGMSTNVPPHNLGEIASGLRQLVVDPECSVADLMRHVPGPDFPTGGFIAGSGGIEEMYAAGRGRVVLRARVVKETLRGAKEQLVVTEIPYGVSKSKVIARIAAVARAGRAPAIADLRDESDRDGMRLVIEMKRNADAAELLSALYRSTSLRVTFGAQLLALDHGEPRLFTLKGLLESFRDHRLTVIRRRARHDLKKARAEQHVTEGLLTALARIDEVVRVIRSSRNRNEASGRLVRLLELSETQAGAVLDMRLARLTALQRSQLTQRLRALAEEISGLLKLLDSEDLQTQTMLDELQEVVESHPSPRRTVILADDQARADQNELEERPADEDVVITLTRQGFVRRFPLHIYRRRTASGKPLVQSYVDDHLVRVFVARSQAGILAFTERGRCFLLPASEVPEASAATRGKSLYALLDGASRDDRIVAAMPVGELAHDDRVAVFATRMGNVKRTRIALYANAGRGGVIALGLRKGDLLVDARISQGSSELVVVSRNGRAIRFAENDVSASGRTAMGVKAITLANEADAVVAMLFAHHRAELLTVTRDGWARRTAFAELPLQRRGGLGALVISDPGETELAAALDGARGDALTMAAGSGAIKSVQVASVPALGRRARGRQVFRPVAGDYVERVARLGVEGVAPSGSEDGSPGSEDGSSGRADVVAGRETTVSSAEDEVEPRSGPQLGLLGR